MGKGGTFVATGWFKIRSCFPAVPRGTRPWPALSPAYRLIRSSRISLLWLMDSLAHAVMLQSECSAAPCGRTGSIRCVVPANSSLRRIRGLRPYSTAGKQIRAIVPSNPMIAPQRGTKLSRVALQPDRHASTVTIPVPPYSGTKPLSRNRVIAQAGGSASISTGGGVRSSPRILRSEERWHEAPSVIEPVRTLAPPQQSHCIVTAQRAPAIKPRSLLSAKAMKAATSGSDAVPLARNFSRACARLSPSR